MLLVLVTLQRPLYSFAALVYNQFLLHLDLYSSIFCQESLATHFSFSELGSAWHLLISSVQKLSGQEGSHLNLVLAAILLSSTFNVSKEDIRKMCLLIPFQVRRRSWASTGRFLAWFELEHCLINLLTQSLSLGRENQDIEMECLG